MFEVSFPGCYCKVDVDCLIYASSTLSCLKRRDFCFGTCCQLECRFVPGLLAKGFARNTTCAHVD